MSRAESNAEYLFWLGEACLQSDRMDKAVETFEQLVHAEPNNSRAQIFLSAIYHALDDKMLARQYLVDGVNLQPVMKLGPGSASVSRKKVLKLSGVESANFILSGEIGGARKVILRGGNFSDAFMVDKSRFDVTTFLVLNGNLVTSEKIPSFDIVLNSIADPDVEGESIKAVSAFLEHNPDKAVINNPNDILPTTRDGNCRRLNEIPGLKFPLTVRLVVDEKFLSNPDRSVSELGFEYPILVRNIGTQTGRTFVKTDSPEQFCKTIQSRKGEEIYLIQYIEALYRDEYFRKMRVFFINGNIYPVVCHIDEIWNVHGSNRTDIMKQNSWMMEQEKSFLEDTRGYLGNTSYGILEKIYEATRLDFFGVDFTITDDGTFLIYEMNPVMRHSHDYVPDFPYLRPFYEDITRAFSDMIEQKISMKAPS